MRQLRADQAGRDVASKGCRASLRTFFTKHCQETAGEQMLKRHSVGSLVCLGQIKKKKADVLIDLKADWCVSRRVSVLLKAL